MGYFGSYGRGKFFIGLLTLAFIFSSPGASKADCPVLKLGQYVHASLGSWNPLGPQQLIEYMGISVMRLKFVLAGITALPLKKGPISTAGITGRENLSIKLFQRNAGLRAGLVLVCVKSNVPPKTLRRRFFSELDKYVKSREDCTRTFLSRARRTRSGHLSLKKKFACFRAMKYKAGKMRRNFLSCWLFYSNPGAGKVFGRRRGEFSVICCIVDEKVGVDSLLKLWSGTNDGISFDRSVTDFFERGWALPLLSPLYGDEKGEWTSTKSAVGAFACSGIVVQGFKRVFAAERPNGHGNVSFPSGHSCSAFSAAGAIGCLHPEARGALLVLAAMTARSRVRSHHHTVFDTIAGGTLGYSIGRYFAAGSKRGDSTAAMCLSFFSLKF